MLVPDPMGISAILANFQPSMPKSGRVWGRRNFYFSLVQADGTVLGPDGKPLLDADGNPLKLEDGQKVVIGHDGKPHIVEVRVFSLDNLTFVFWTTF